MQKNESINLNYYPGHMAKAKKQIIEDLKIVDIVIEILDARCPKASQNPDIENLIQEKKKIIILNKSDLADEIETRKWQKYFRNQGFPTIIANSKIGINIKDVIITIKSLMQSELDKNIKKGIIGKSIRIMVLGIPNVGKSSFINSISKKNCMKVGNKPGITKQKQWVRLEGNIDLLDTPGVLWPKFSSKVQSLYLAYTGTIKDEILDEYEIAYFLIEFLYNNYKILLQKRYKITDEEVDNIFSQNTQAETKFIELIELIGKKRGAVMSGGIIDQTKTAKIILDDFRNGKIGNITLEKI